ncbi:hypothetical protein MNBD_ALPHA06-1524 [hydrothermal vent metagenome]|uniref:Uncharacterized protein n=1 Tax=hydrothermal vent metagenome TaxID=652676 RepID=A0A3B0R5I3_9ZZZZ
MYLSQPNIGPGTGKNAGFLARIIAFLRKSAIWLVGIAFATVVAIGTFFFAMAAIIGTFILAGVVAFAWFLFKMLGPKGFQPKNFSAGPFPKTGPETLDATKGPKGWTVNGRDPFGQ